QFPADRPFVSSQVAQPKPSCTVVTGEIASAFSQPSIERSKSPPSARSQHPGNASIEADREAFLSGFHPLLVRSHASGHLRRPAARRRSAFRTPLPEQVWAPAPE